MATTKNEPAKNGNGKGDKGAKPAAAPGAVIGSTGEAVSATREFTEHTAESATAAAVEAAKQDESGPEPLSASDDSDSGPKPLRKISPATIFEAICGNGIKQLAVGGRMELPLQAFVILGRVTNLLEDYSDFGNWTALVGEFESQALFVYREVEVTVDGKTKKENRVIPVGLGEGRTFVSSKCFIPGPAGDALISATRNILGDEIKVESPSGRRKTFEALGDYIEVACLVSVHAAKREGGAPYEYDVEPLVKLAKTNLLDGLRARVAANMAKAITAANARMLPAPKQ